LTSGIACGIGFAKLGRAGRGWPARIEEVLGMTDKSGSRSRGKTGIVLVCDGRNVPLNPFVQRFIEETVVGMVRALEGVPKELQRIDLRIRRR
jgi:hypothetical protein